MVPRRLRVPLVSLGAPENVSVLDALPVGQRSRTPSLYPGAAYDVSDRVTGLRGRVVRQRSWSVRPGACRCGGRASRRDCPTGGPPVAWAHGDQHGEFLLVLPPEAIASPAVQMPRTLALDVIAHGRRGLPASPSADARATRRSVLGSAARNARRPRRRAGERSRSHSAGRFPPTTTARSTQSVTFTYSQIVSSGIPPFDIT